MFDVSATVLLKTVVAIVIAAKKRRTLNFKSHDHCSRHEVGWERTRRFVAHGLSLVVWLGRDSSKSLKSVGEPQEIQVHNLKCWISRIHDCHSSKIFYLSYKKKTGMVLMCLWTWTYFYITQQLELVWEFSKNWILNLRSSIYRTIEQTRYTDGKMYVSCVDVPNQKGVKSKSCSEIVRLSYSYKVFYQHPGQLWLAFPWRISSNAGPCQCFSTVDSIHSIHLFSHMFNYFYIFPRSLILWIIAIYAVGDNYLTRIGLLHPLLWLVHLVPPSAERVTGSMPSRKWPLTTWAQPWLSRLCNNLHSNGHPYQCMLLVFFFGNTELLLSLIFLNHHRVQAKFRLTWMVSRVYDHFTCVAFDNFSTF